MNNDVVRSSSKSAEFTSVEHVIWCSTGIRNLKIESAVCTPYERQVATGESATVSTLILFDLMYRCSAEVTNIFSVPHGVSTKNKRCIIGTMRGGVRNQVRTGDLW